MGKHRVTTASGKAKTAVYSSAFSNTLGIFCQCFVAFATYSMQHQGEDQVEAVSWLTLAYVAGSALFAWAEWKENVTYDGEKMVKNIEERDRKHRRRKHRRRKRAKRKRWAPAGGAVVGSGDEEEGQATPMTPLVGEDKAVSTDGGTFVVVSSESDDAPTPPGCSAGFTMLKVGMKDFLEISFIYFAVKLRILNAMNDEQRVVAPFDPKLDCSFLLTYWLLSFPFKYHSKILNSALPESNPYKTGRDIGAGLFWFGVIAHSLEHYLPLVLTVMPVQWIKAVPKAPLVIGFTVISALLMTTETLFTRSFDGEECLDRIMGKKENENENRKWELSDCFKPLLKWTWPYKPVARISDDTLAVMSILSILSFSSEMPTWATALIGVALSLPAGVGSYLVDVTEARKHLGMG